MTNKENIINLVATIKNLFTTLVTNIKIKVSNIYTCIGTIKSEVNTCIDNIYTCIGTMKSTYKADIGLFSHPTLYAKTNGYTKLCYFTGYLTFQWGYVEYDSTVTGYGSLVTFPVKFNTKCFNVLVCYANDNSCDYESHSDVSATDVTTTGFTFFCRGNGGEYPKSNYFPFYWQAIGY